MSLYINDALGYYDEHGKKHCEWSKECKKIPIRFYKGKYYCIDHIDNAKATYINYLDWEKKFKK